MNRLKILTELVRNKNVLHFGFGNYEKYHEKIGKGLWLHSLLLSSAKLCIGVDIDTRVKSLADCEIWNIEKELIPDRLKMEWDYILLPEIIEHINNPVNFLIKVKEIFPDSTVIITVTNAFYIKNFVNCFFQKEIVNPDHRYWFTKYTIEKILKVSGYSNIKIEFVNGFDRGLFTGFFLKIFPYFRDNLLIKTI